MRCPRCSSRSFTRDQDGRVCLLCGHRGGEVSREPTAAERNDASAGVRPVGGHGNGTWYVKARGAR